MGAHFRLLMNTRFDALGAYPEDAGEVLNAAAFEVARAAITAWPEYAVTPLRPLPGVAERCGVGSVLLKDESPRFGLGSFKAIGGAYGALRAVQAELATRFGIEASAAQLRRGVHREHAGRVVLACATDGNHGRAVAWAARAFGCRCEVFVPRIVSAARRAAIAELGARVTAVEGTYDDALRHLDAAAQRHEWLVVSDQAYPGYEVIPRDIMQGYALVAEEVLRQWPAGGGPTHVFVQAGVGGFAAAMCAHLWERCGAQRPLFVCVEPMAADCVYRSAVAGRMERVPGDLDTVMACLSCGEPSTLGWRVLERGAAAFVAVDDESAVEAMRALAFPAAAEQALVVGESGAAGLAALLRVAADGGARRDLALDEASRVLLFASEGATDPEAYAELVGVAPVEVAGRGGATRG